MSLENFLRFLTFSGEVGEGCKLNGNGRVVELTKFSPLEQQCTGVAAVSSIFSGQNVLGT